MHLICRPRSRISSRVTNKNQDKVVKVVQTRAECNTESMLNIPSENQSLGAIAGLVTESLLLILTAVLGHCLLSVCQYSVPCFHCLEESEISS